MSINKNVRLTDLEIKIIKETIIKYDNEATVILFGSRIDLSKKGGDIDLLVISKQLDYKQKRQIKVAFFNTLGDRKIDLIVTDDYNKSEFTKIMFNNGVKL